MKIRITSLLVTLLAMAAPAALAQSSSPIVSITVTDIAVAGGTDWGTGGTNVNGGSGPYTSAITIGTTEAGAAPFTVEYYINGVDIGPNSLYSFPSPGTYYISAQVTDANGHSAFSVAVEFFATGVQIVSPLNNAVIPAGSSVVIQAAAAIANSALNIAGAPAEVAFFIPPSTTPFAISYNYPYSVIFTPQGAAGTTAYYFAVAYNPPAVSSASALAPPTPLGPNPGEAAANSNSGVANSILIQEPAQAPPTCVITTPTGTPASPTEIPIPNYANTSGGGANASITVNVDAVPGTSTGFITKVELYINGVLYGTATEYPYQFSWKPTVTGTYDLTALAYDDEDNVIASTTSTSATATPQPTTVVITPLPAVSITSPNNGGILNAGATTTITATATDAVGILNVQFFQDGNFLGVATQPNSGTTNQYSATFKPTQNITTDSNGNSVVNPSTLIAIATDTLGASQTSPGITVTVTAGGAGGGTTVIGTPPTVSITSPATATSVIVNTPTTIMVSANAPNGSIAQVSFLIYGKVVETITQYPYQYVWTPTNLGTYQITAEVTDNVGDVTNSSSIAVTVTPEPPPTVSITAPTSGGTVTVGTSVTINANAVSSSGTITQVQFYANGISLGTTTSSPYTFAWTPEGTGLYTLTAIATDNAGETTTSDAVIVEAEPVNTAAGTVTYFGTYQGLVPSDGGTFAFITNDGVLGTYIAISNTDTKNPVTFYPDLSVAAVAQSTTATTSTPSIAFSSKTISGTASSAGVNGILSPGGEIFIGSAAQSTNVAVASGYYTGDIAGQSNSQVTGIVGPDGEIMVYVNEGSFTDAGYGSYGSVNANGAFTVTTVGGNSISGTVNPSTGFLNAALSGGPGGTILAARVSGGTFSDGVLSNLSTRGDVLSGSNIMIAGFVVSGTTPKNLLIRASGPALTALGVTGAIAGTELSVYSGPSTVVAANTGWSITPTNQSEVQAADTQVSAFPFAAGSADSALIGTFPPGAYTAMVTGVGTNTGISLVEVYDLDSFVPFTANKLINVSTRGYVGSGADVLIAGFNITGTAPKRLLIRADGPALSAYGVSGYLAAPRLQLFNSSATVIRENFEWQTGNDPGLVSAAAAASGAFALPNGSSDSSILIVLPPGSYTAQVSGQGGTTGTAEVEVYEVP